MSDRCSLLWHSVSLTGDHVIEWFGFGFLIAECLTLFFNQLFSELLILRLSNFQCKLIQNLHPPSIFSRCRKVKFFLCYRTKRRRLLSSIQVARPYLSFSNNWLVLHLHFYLYFTLKINYFLVFNYLEVKMITVLNCFELFASQTHAFKNSI